MIPVCSTYACMVKIGLIVALMNLVINDAAKISNCTKNGAINHPAAAS
jgi:hypothetical protein